MELNNTKMKQEQKEHGNSKVHLIFLLLLGMAIGAILFASITLIRNAEEISTDPVQYSINNDIYDSCTCVKEGIGVITFNQKLNEVTENRSG